MSSPMAGFRFAIDRGGTFTDVYARCPDGQTRVMKLLSEDPGNYPDAPREGIRRILQQETGQLLPADQPLDTSQIEWIRMGTTVATNALLERKGERMALVINKGMKDLLYIGNQSRPQIFDLEIVTPDMLYEEVVEVSGRVILQQERCGLPRRQGLEIVTGTTGEKLEVREDLNKEKLRADLQKVLDKGIRSLAVVLIHAYTFESHEREIGEIARQMGFSHISLSSAVMPMVRMVPRGYTACADAYLTPCIRTYLTSFAGGFRDNLQGKRVLVMQSDGGLTPMEKFNGSRAILSGPAGGVVGYAVTTYKRETDLPVIGFDMGGTSTDVSRYAGEYEHVFETTTAGVTIQAPQLDINTVAAGGGSRLFFRSGLFVVGPESAGAHPGPACYRKGGPLCVTDANLVLGRLRPEFFPSIFGKTEDQPLDMEASVNAFMKLTQEVNEFLASQPEGTKKDPMSMEEVAMGFINVANETMCRPIRALTQAKGHDTSRHVLACFGGAGGQHACDIARSLGMSTVFIHRYSGILSAYGMALADVVHEAQEPCALRYEPSSLAKIDDRIDELTRQCVQELQAQGFARSQIETEPYLHLRYDRTDCALMCSAADYPASQTTCRHGDFELAFNSRYKREFGFTIPGRPIVVDDIRVRGVGKTDMVDDRHLRPSNQKPKFQVVTKCYFDVKYWDTKLYLLEDLSSDHTIEGPAILIEKNSTIVVEPNCQARITEHGDIKIQVGSGIVKHIGTELDTIQLSIFSHRFMSTAEQMGRILQRTAISTNIKERLDFSCAMFGYDGGLVANAPHIPVHLGAMQETVQYQMAFWGDDLREGDMILTNHPCAGGSHLPDLTVITPVFYPGSPKPVFYVASRGHHADIGGTVPGSMPPNSKHLNEEGAVFETFKLVKDGIFQEEALIEALMAPGKIPGSSGTRNLHDNLSDLRAQVAANQKGINLIKELIDSYGLDVVMAYMGHIQSNAEIAVREMLREIGRNTQEKLGTTRLSAQDYLDDGTPIVLSIDINIEEGTAFFDFTGTGFEVYGNLNAPKAITKSAIIYCLRCMIGHDVPLNQGCLKPIQLHVPKGSILDPSHDAAVIGGNVLTCQRVVDVILKAFGVCAASQGCMNNTTFGDDDVGYYETVAGGAGAGPTWDGRSGIHTHMTNTRITDPEILERRYPVVLKRFELNPNTGGRGKFMGGDGVVREMMFRRPLTVSVLTERRTLRPYGLNGGEPGQQGKNLFTYASGRIVNLGAKTAIRVSAGDTLCLCTPGGGGYGTPAEEDGEVDYTILPSKRRCYNKMASQLYMEKGSVHAYRLAQEQV
ncbi:5-oxoprolinase-like [Patiria miniata]|uniref:5-oxoprolinase n=1 Tax=Patiria miniata TaxID=46514 RepID=A0A914B396_PATMI|nr:5-oxoprolinase-like [Patiria miniata]XP_038070279.1 5-oxoprolinase-like [Patiria miniata]XP_038070280.1 5-oxoprolinase-like [Patiria miniata]